MWWAISSWTVPTITITSTRWSRSSASPRSTARSASPVRNSVQSARQSLQCSSTTALTPSTSTNVTRASRGSLVTDSTYASKSNWTRSAIERFSMPSTRSAFSAARSPVVVTRLWRAMSSPSREPYS